jgi:hypothetical protein
LINFGSGGPAKPRANPNVEQNLRATESHICSLPNIESKKEVPASSDSLLTSRGAPVGAALSPGIAFAVVTGNVRFAAWSPDALRTP